MKMKNRKAKTAEYYDFQRTQDKMYADSLNGRVFTNLMDAITCDENIKLAYRNIKRNNGSRTAGTDGVSIEDFAGMGEEGFVDVIRTALNNYHPKQVKRVEIPKPNGKLRPLGIPCMRDRIVQQCILQVLEPICEAKFNENSHGFRPNRSAENAIATAERLMQRSHMAYVVDVDIKGFFDNVNHRKLMRQLWTLGIRDTKLLQIIKQMLKAEVKMPDGAVVTPTKGTPQGGILSPLLANVVLNEFDWWISSQWQNQYKVMKNPPKEQYNKKGTRYLTNEYRTLRKTKLKEVYIVRYADDFKLFCKTKGEATRIKGAVSQWLRERLKLEVSGEKTKVTNLKRRYSEFLGFKMKLQKKGDKRVINARMCDKAVKNAKIKLTEQIKLIQKPKNNNELYQRVNQYNLMVVGTQNYYQIANNVTKDFSHIQFQIDKLIKNRLDAKKEGTINNKYLQSRYGKSKQVRWVNNIPIMPIGYCKSRNPMHKKVTINQYTPRGRAELYKPPDVDIGILHYIMRNPVQGRSVEYNDNRVSLYVGQRGKCAITSRELEIGLMHCHHKIPRKLGGKDEYGNLVFICDEVHKLIHATNPDTISKYLSNLKLNDKQISKVNQLRSLAGLEPVA